MAKYKKKRARELKHDKFRDAAMKAFERLGDQLEGKGRTILYGIAGLVIVTLIVGSVIRWTSRHDDEARQALGRAITIASAPVSPMPVAGATTPSYTSAEERAQKAIEEFQKVAAKYGEPYRTEARYFIAVNSLSVDRPRGISELTELTKSSNAGVATLSRFALAQAKEADGEHDQAKYEEAAALYRDLAKQNDPVVTPETATLRLAMVYEKQGKKKEAADLLFGIVDAARKKKDADNQPAAQSQAARDAAQELQKLDPARYAQLPPESPGDLAL